MAKRSGSSSSKLLPGRVKLYRPPLWSELPLPLPRSPGRLEKDPCGGVNPLPLPLLNRSLYGEFIDPAAFLGACGHSSGFSNDGERCLLMLTSSALGLGTGPYVLSWTSVGCITTSNPSCSASNALKLSGGRSSAPKLALRIPKVRRSPISSSTGRARCCWATELDLL